MRYLKLKYLFLLFYLLIALQCTQCSEKKEEKADKNKTSEKKEEKEEETERKIDLKEEKIDDLYSIGLVSYLSKTEGINDLASLQVSNSDKEVYLLVIEDNKKDIKKDFSINQYYDLALSNLSQSLQDIKSINPQPNKINGLNALSGKITGKFTDAGWVYYITIVESETYYYQIIAWTISKNTEQTREIEAMINSFKQL